MDKLYIIGIHSCDSDEIFIKVGITNSNVSKRFNKGKAFKGKYRIHSVNQWSFEDRKEAYKLEQAILKKFKCRKHQPLNNFDGKTECLEHDCLNEIIKVLKTKNDTVIPIDNWKDKLANSLYKDEIPSSYITLAQKIISVENFISNKYITAHLNLWGIK